MFFNKSENIDVKMIFPSNIPVHFAIATSVQMIAIRYFFQNRAALMATKQMSTARHKTVPIPGFDSGPPVNTALKCGPLIKSKSIFSHTDANHDC